MFNEEIERFLSRKGYMKVEPRAALIDMDGTLYDSMPRHAAAWKQMTAELGINLPIEEFYLHEGRTGADTIDLLFRKHFNRSATDEEIDRLYHLKTIYFSEFPDDVPTMPGASDMLEFMINVGMKRVLVTGSAQNSLIDRIDCDFPGAFLPDMCVTAKEVRHGKPAPDPFLLGMEKAKVVPMQTIVVENAPLGVEAGDRAGAFTIGITTGPIPESTLYDAGAAIVFPSMRDFADKLPFLIYALDTFSRNYN